MYAIHLKLKIIKKLSVDARKGICFRTFGLHCFFEILQISVESLERYFQTLAVRVDVVEVKGLDENSNASLANGDAQKLQGMHENCISDS